MQLIFLLLILLGIYELGIGCFQCLGVCINSWSSQTVCGTFNNPGPYSIFIVILLPIAFFYALRINSLCNEKRLISKVVIILSLVYFVVSIIVLAVSLSRASWLAGIISCGLVLWLTIRKNRELKIKRKYVIIAVCSFILFVGFVYKIKENSADGRLLIWKISTTIMKESFICGVGHGRFPSAYGEAQEIYFRAKQGTKHEEYIAGAPEFAYNEYIQVLVEYGIIGLLALILVIGYSFYHLRFVNSPYKTPLLGAFSALLVVSFFSYPFHNLYTCLLAIFIMALVTFLPDQRYSQKKINIIYTVLSLSLGFAFYIVCTSFGTLGNIKIAYCQWNILKPYFNAGRFSEIVKNYKTLYPYLSSDAGYLFEYGQCLSRTGSLAESNQILQKGLCYSGDPMFLNIIGKNLQKMGQYKDAEEMFYKSYYRIPHKIYPLYLLMNLYEEQGKDDKVRLMVRRIIMQKEKITSLETMYIKKKAKEKLKEIALKTYRK